MYSDLNNQKNNAGLNKYERLAEKLKNREKYVSM